MYVLLRKTDDFLVTVDVVFIIALMLVLADVGLTSIIRFLIHAG